MEFLETYLYSHTEYSNPDKCATELGKQIKVHACACPSDPKDKAPLFDKSVSDICSMDAKASSAYGMLLSCASKEGICSLDKINSDSKCYNSLQNFQAQTRKIVESKSSK
jgi:hypothetical protein